MPAWTAGRIVDRKKFWSSTIFLLGGAAIAWQATSYEVGTPTQMGPGFFPLLLGVLLAVLGAAGAVTACRGSSAVAVGAWPLPPLLFVSAGLVAFAVLITAGGLLAAVSCLVVLSCYGRLRRKPAEVLLIVLSMSAVTYAIFVTLLQLPIALL